MSLNLNVIPVNWAVPGVYVGVDGSGAVSGTPGMRKPVLLLGTRLAAGTVAEKVLKPITGPSQGSTYFGRGSQLASMCAAYVAANPYTEVYALALDADAAGVAATATVTIVGTATADGTLSFVWAGRKIKAAVLTGDTPTVIAASIAAAVNADLDNQTTAASALGVVTATCRHKGAFGNSLSIVLNYYVGDETPSGITSVTITAFASGATNPDIEDAIGALGGDSQYYTIVTGWTDDANMDALEDEMASRWGPIRAIPGHIITAFRGDHTASQTYGDARNSQFSTVLATGLSPTAPWIWAASLAAIEVAENDPAKPRQNIKIPGVLAPLEIDRFTITERNLLLLDGMATYKVISGDSYIERMVTSSQLNAGGDEDPTYKDIETLRCITYFRYGFSSRILRKYPNAKLGNDGENFAPGIIVMTPKLMRGECLAFFDELNFLAIVEDRKQFAAELICVRNQDNPNQMDVFLPPNFVNQFRICAAVIGFKL
jgi:phage tail sheath gpL-like